MRWYVWCNQGKSGEPTRDKREARIALHMSRIVRPDLQYKLVRLVTKREKLKRKLAADADRMEGFANGGYDTEAMWQKGYARALRDIASQL